MLPHLFFPMKALKDRILKDGKCFPGGILKVDSLDNCTITLRDCTRLTCVPKFH